MCGTQQLRSSDPPPLPVPRVSRVLPRIGRARRLLVERDDVFDAAVVGVDDSDFGKRLRAFIVSQPGAPQDIEEIKLYVKNNLARYKVPRDVVFIDELPRNATGKLLRRVLTEMDVDS
jgi:fatty-acyl-CoA synthase